MRSICFRLLLVTVEHAPSMEISIRGFDAPHVLHLILTGRFFQLNGKQVLNQWLRHVKACFEA